MKEKYRKMKRKTFAVEGTQPNRPISLILYL